MFIKYDIKTILIDNQYLITKQLLFTGFISLLTFLLFYVLLLTCLKHRKVSEPTISLIYNNFNLIYTTILLICLSPTVIKYIEHQKMIKIYQENMRYVDKLVESKKFKKLESDLEYLLDITNNNEDGFPIVTKPIINNNEYNSIKFFTSCYKPNQSDSTFEKCIANIFIQNLDNLKNNQPLQF